MWRRPQNKPVYVYRIIALGTSDVFLNNIGFEKGAMHDAFLGVTPTLRKSLPYWRQDGQLTIV